MALLILFHPFSVIVLVVRTALDYEPCLKSTRERNCICIRNLCSCCIGSAGICSERSVPQSANAVSCTCCSSMTHIRRDGDMHAPMHQEQACMHASLHSQPSAKTKKARQQGVASPAETKHPFANVSKAALREAGIADHCLGKEPIKAAWTLITHPTETGHRDAQAPQSIRGTGLSTCRAAHRLRG